MLKVVKTEPGTDKGFEQVKDEVKQRVLAERAANQLYDKANKADNILGTGAGLDKLPSDLGLAGVTGTLDAAGNTKDGKPAPIPGPPELRKALIAAAFSKPPGEPPSELTEVQTPSTGGSAFYAVEVEDVQPPSVKPFDQVKDQVQTDFTTAARQKDQEKQAAQIMAAVKGGESLEDAATKAGLSVRTTPLVARDQPNATLPAQLQRVLFGLKKGEPTMVETADAFIVAVPDKIETPDPKAEPARYDEMKQVLTRTSGTDIAAIFTAALRERAHPHVNATVFELIRPTVIKAAVTKPALRAEAPR